MKAILETYKSNKSGGYIIEEGTYKKFQLSHPDDEQENNDPDIYICIGINMQLCEPLKVTLYNNTVGYILVKALLMSPVAIKEAADNMQSISMINSKTYLDEMGLVIEWLYDEHQGPENFSKIEYVKKHGPTKEQLQTARNWRDFDLRKI